MPSIFAGGNIGAVVLAKSVRPATFSMVATKPRMPTKIGLISGIQWQDGVNAQFPHTMGDDIYMNVFGNRMGTLTIKGIAFSDFECKGASKHGIIDIIDWYKEHRVSTTGKNIIVTVGGTEAISGFLIGASYSTDDTENWLVGYQLEVATVPRAM